MSTGLFRQFDVTIDTTDEFGSTCQYTVFGVPQFGGEGGFKDYVIPDPVDSPNAVVIVPPTNWTNGIYTAQCDVTGLLFGTPDGFEQGFPCTINGDTAAGSFIATYGDTLSAHIVCYKRGAHNGGPKKLRN